MLKLTYQRKTHYLGVQDTQAIQQIKERYGCSTDSDAVRLALRVLAESPIVRVEVKKRKTA